MGITQSEWEEHSEAADLLRGKQTPISVSPIQGYLLQEDLHNSRTFPLLPEQSRPLPWTLQQEAHCFPMEKDGS